MERLQCIQTVARLNHAAVDQILACRGRQVVGGFEGADVVEVFACDEGDVVAGDQCAVGCQAVVGLGEIQHGHQHFFAVHFVLFEPDNVMGQGRDLLRSEAHANGQIELVLAGDGVVHQVLELIFVGGLSVDERLAGAGGDRLLDEALFVEAVAEAFLRQVRVVTQGREHVVRAHELLEVGEHGVGFDEVFAGA